MHIIHQRLTALGIELPKTPKVVANYAPYVISGNLIFISGQLPFHEGALAFKGKVGQTHTVEDAQQAARICGLNILAQLNAACGGGLERVKQCIRLGGFVNCDSTFTEHPRVINGASDLMVQVFGDAGIHARAAVGANALPLDATVEVEALFEVLPCTP